MAPLATASPTYPQSESQIHARIQAKLTIRPEESIHGATESQLNQLHNTVQVTRPVWNKLGGHSHDTHGKVKSRKGCVLDRLNMRYKGAGKGSRVDRSNPVCCSGENKPIPQRLTDHSQFLLFALPTKTYFFMIASSKQISFGSGRHRRLTRRHPYPFSRDCPTDTSQLGRHQSRAPDFLDRWPCSRGKQHFQRSSYSGTQIEI